MKLSERQQIFAQNVARLILKMNESPYSCTLGEAYRTPEQSRLNAKTGTGIKNSLHCKRLAVDLNLFLSGVYCADTESHRSFGEYWESLNSFNRWGGRFSDGNHYEMKESV